MKHLVTYKAANAALIGEPDEYTVITEHPMHMSSGVEAFIQEKATKHGFNTVDITKLEIHRIVIVFIKELDRH